MNADRLLAYYEQIADAPDAIARLRRFILDLAVRGKLVPQDPDDEPASELLKRIAAEKARLVKAGEIRKRDELPELAGGDQPFLVPSTWLWCRLGALGWTQTGTTPPKAKPEHYGDYIPFIKPGDLYPNHVDYSNEGLSKLGITESGRLATPGSILMVCIGTIGKCQRIERNCSFNQQINSLSPFSETDSRYLLAACQSEMFQRAAWETSARTTIAILNKGNWELLAVPLPPLAEQHRIVAKVDELMALCDQLEAARTEREASRDRLAAASLARLNAPDPETFEDDARFALNALPALTTRPDQIKALRQTILNLAVRGKLVPQDPSDEPASDNFAFNRPAIQGKLNIDIPANWRWVPVEDVADARLGKMLDKAKNKGRPYPYLRNTNVHWFDIRLDDLKTMLLEDTDFEEYRLRDGDVLICEGGHGIGRTAVWRGKSDNLVFQKALHRVRPSKQLDPDFFAQCCFVYFDEGIMQTYFTGVGIPHFTGRALSKLIFPLPPLAEQHRIVAKVDELMALCDQLEANLTNATSTRSRLLNALLAEALVPHDTRDLEAVE